MNIVVIMPTYNEKENIIKMIPVLEKDVFPKVGNKHLCSLLVVDDNSPDGTGDKVKEFMKQWKNIELLTGNKQGLGAAYVRGMQYAMKKMHADAVIEFDADFQHDPHDIPRLIQAMDEGADYVIGSRYIPGGEIPKEWGLNRKILSYYGGSWLGRIMLGFWNIHDITAGYKLTKTSFLKKVDLDHLYSKDFAYKMQILHDVVKQGAKVKEIPVVFYERTEGNSKISQKDQFDSLYVLARLRWDDSQRFIKFLVVGGTGFIVQLIAQEGSVAIGLALALGLGIKMLFPHTNIEVIRDGIAAGIGAELAIISNFLFNNYWTFQDANNVHQSANFFVRLIKFNVTSLAAIFIQFAAVAAAVFFWGEKLRIGHYAIATRIVVLFPVIILLVIPLNYLIYNKLIWKTQYLKAHTK
ncbi:MAG TPA: glycosyltransferase [Candidatus Saccharimonadales bacterium]|nr:glycosyltransferase [Candidatus Saccharimonadales bacterium]